VSIIEDVVDKFARLYAAANEIEWNTSGGVLCAERIRTRETPDIHGTWRLI
jgi:hypothetical protein